MSEPLQVPDEDTQFELPTGPDLKRPDWIFRDGKGIGCVRALPVVVPTWGVKGTQYSVEDGLLLIIATHLRQIWWRNVRQDRDDRWKVIAARSKRRFPYFSRTYAIQFAADEEEAEALQLAMLKEWPTKRYADAVPLGPRERRRLRLASLPATDLAA